MKFVLTRHVNEEVAFTGKYNNFGDAYDAMKHCLMSYEGAFDKTKFYNKYFTGKSFKDDDHFIIFPNEWDAESADYFMLKKLDEQPVARKRPPEEAAEEECQGDLHPMRWRKQPNGFAVVYAMIMQMSQTTYDKFLQARARSFEDYTRCERELCDRRGVYDLSRFAAITADINGCEKTYLSSVRHFLTYMCQSDLPPVESLYNITQLCAHTPVNPFRVQLLIFEVAMAEIFNLRDFNSGDMVTLGFLLKKSIKIQEKIDDTTSYNNDSLLECYSRIDPSWFLDPSFLPFIRVFVDFGGADLLWKAIPTNKEFTLHTLELLHVLKDDMAVDEFMVRLDQAGYSYAQIEFYVFIGEDSPDEACFNLLFQFFMKKGDRDQAERVLKLKLAKFPAFACV